MGLVIYSPRLNDLGIPPLAEAFCKQITLRYRVNLFDQLVYGDSVIEANDGDQNVKATSMKQSLLFFELCTASGEGNVKRVQELIEDGADVNRVDYDKRSALHIACSDGHYEVAKLLVKEGASILVKDRWGQTPYDDAIRGGHHTIIDLLNAGLAAQGYRIHAAPFLQALQPPVAVTEAAAAPPKVTTSSPARPRHLRPTEVFSPSSTPSDENTEEGQREERKVESPIPRTPKQFGSNHRPAPLHDSLDPLESDSPRQPLDTRQIFLDEDQKQQAETMSSPTPMNEY